MAVVRGCEVPEDLLYDLEREVWVRFLPDGTALLGMTDLAQTRCGRLVHLSVRAPGRRVAQGRAVATVESAKWVGPFPAPFTLEVLEVNPAVARDPVTVNRDPYGEGWLVRVRPAGPPEERAHLVTGQEAVRAYLKKTEDLNLHCFRCAE